MATFTYLTHVQQTDVQYKFTSNWAINVIETDLNSLIPQNTVRLFSASNFLRIKISH